MPGQYGGGGEAGGGAQGGGGDCAAEGYPVQKRNIVSGSAGQSAGAGDQGVGVAGWRLIEWQESRVGSVVEGGAKRGRGLEGIAFARGLAAAAQFVLRTHRLWRGRIIGSFGVWEEGCFLTGFTGFTGFPELPNPVEATYVNATV